MRPTYHVFDLYANYTDDKVIDVFVRTPEFTVKEQAGWEVSVPYIDAVVTHDEENKLSIIVSNLHREESVEAKICLFNIDIESVTSVKVITGESADSYNDIGKVGIDIAAEKVSLSPKKPFFQCSPHSITLIQLQLK